ENLQRLAVAQVLLTTNRHLVGIEPPFDLRLRYRDSHDVAGEIGAQCAVARRFEPVAQHGAGAELRRVLGNALRGELLELALRYANAYGVAANPEFHQCLSSSLTARHSTPHRLRERARAAAVATRGAGLPATTCLTRYIGPIRADASDSRHRI